MGLVDHLEGKLDVPPARGKDRSHYWTSGSHWNGVSRELVSGYTRAGPLRLLPSALAETAAIWLQRFGDVGQGTRGGRLGRRRPFGRAKG